MLSLWGPGQVCKGRVRPVQKLVGRLLGAGEFSFMVH